MREIKFRGKSKKTGEWLYGSLLISYFKDNKGVEKYYITQFIGNYTFEHEVVPETVGQYTGINTNDNKEVYEGDIVDGIIYDWDDHREESRQVKYTSEVKYLHASFQVKRKHHGSTNFINWMPLLNYDNDSDESLYIIGNIHDYPNLINQ